MKRTVSVWYRVYLTGVLLLALAETGAVFVYSCLRTVPNGRPIAEHRSANQIAPNYRLTILPTLGGKKSYHGAGGLNNRGQVVGAAMLEDGTIRAFLWENGQIIDLGTLGGTTSTARAINDKGQIVGGAGTQTGMRAFLWEHGKIHDLGIVPGFTHSLATDINTSGEVVGRVYTTSSEPYWTWPTLPFVWKEGRMKPLPLPPGCTRAQAAAINDKGVIVGWGTDAKNNTVACMWDKGRAINIGKILGKEQSSITAINNQGQIAGTAGNSEKDMRGFLYQKGTVHWMPVLPYQTRGRAAALTDDGTLYADARVGHEHLPAIFWHPGEEKVRDLLDEMPDNSTYFPKFVFAVNERGQALLFGDLSHHSDRLALLTLSSRPSP